MLRLKNNEALGVVRVSGGRGGARIGGINVGTGFNRGFATVRGWGNWGNWLPYNYYYEPYYAYATPTCVSPCLPAPDGSGNTCYTSGGYYAYCSPARLAYSLMPIQYWAMAGTEQQSLGACAMSRAAERNMMPANPLAMGGCKGPCVGGRCDCWKRGGCACRKGG